MSSSRRVVHRWTTAWLGGAAIGVANGVVREATYGKRMSDYTAYQLSVLSAIGAFGVYFWQLQRGWPLPDQREAQRVGQIWLGLTVLFELGFGRLVAKQSWSDLLADYQVIRGRSWPLVLALALARPHRHPTLAASMSKTSPSQKAESSEIPAATGVGRPARMPAPHPTLPQSTSTGFRSAPAATPYA